MQAQRPSEVMDLSPAVALLASIIAAAVDPAVNELGR